MYVKILRQIFMYYLISILFFQVGFFTTIYAIKL